jgi:hypothetical protein
MYQSLLQDMFNTDHPETPPDDCPFGEDTFVLIDKYNLDQLTQDTDSYTEDITLDVDDNFFKPPSKPPRPEAISMLEQELRNITLNSKPFVQVSDLAPIPDLTPETSESGYNISKLFDYPNRAHLRIIPYLTQQDIGSCRLISKRWNRLFTPAFYSHMTIGSLANRDPKFNRDPKDKQFLLAPTRKHIQKVTIQGVFKTNIFKELDVDFPNASELKMVDFHPMLSSAYEINLQDKFPRLNRVHFVNSTNWKDSSPRLKIKPLNNLQHLSFKNRQSKVPLPKFFNDTIVNSPNLTRLSFVNTRVEYQDLNHLRKNVRFLGRLEMVNWFGEYQLDYSHFENKWRHYLREHSYITDPVDSDAPFQVNLDESHTKSFNAYLKHFSERNGRTLDEWLAKVIIQNNQLYSIRLEQLGQLDFTLKYLSKTVFKSLTSITLGSSRINPKQLNNIFVNCTRLNYVKLYLMLDVNDDHINHLTENNPGLETLELDFIPITDVAINYIRARLFKLVDLKLKRLTRVQFRSPSKNLWACNATLMNFDFYILPDYIQLEKFLLPFTRLTKFSFIEYHFESSLAQTLRSLKPDCIIKPIQKNVFEEA